MKRLPEFDFIKLFAIFLVLEGHCTQYFLTTENPIDEPLYRIIYTFHMPLFIMVSGFFACSSLKKTWKPFLVNKALQLLLPCLTWGTLFYLILSVISNPERSYGSFLDHNLWFLKCLFTCYLIYYIVFRTCKKFYWATAISFVIALIFPSSYVQALFPYFLIGVLLQRHYDIFCRYRNKITSATLILFILLSCYNTTDVYWSRTPLSFLLGLSGSVCIVGLIHLLTEKIGTSSLFRSLAHLGQYTLGVYILQSFILEKLMPMYISFDDFPEGITHFIIHPILSLLLLVICITITQLVYKNRYTALVFFGKRR